jgi:hypothetical protein
MKRRNIFPWLLGLVLLATTSPILTACSSDDDNNSGGNGKEQTDSLTAMYDDLEFLQRSLCMIDSAGKLVRYEIGEAINKSEPEHRYIGVDDIEEAAKMFANWIAPDVKLAEITPTVSDLTAELTDTLGHAQGTIYFRAGSGTTVAEVTASAGTNLKYVSRITFLLNSAWPYNSETIVWHKGDIRRFRITGRPGKYLLDPDKELDFVLIREGRNGQMPMWVTVTKEKYPYKDFWDKNGTFIIVAQSSYCPADAKARTISDIMRGDWDFFKGRLNDADAGELRDGGSYLIDGWHGWPVTFQHIIMLSNGWIHGTCFGVGGDGPEQFLLKVDWLNDDQLPLRATAGTNITSGFEDVRGSYDNLFDGLNDTMWETNHLTWASQSDPKYYVEFESSKLIKPTGYTLVTGSVDQWPKDNCNPHTWKLYGKRKTRDNWTLLDERSGQNLPFESYRSESYSLSNGGGEYQYFRLEIIDDQPWLKLAEFKLVQ